MSEEVWGIYTLGPTDTLARDAVWLYSERALELDALCSLGGGAGLAEVELNLVPGWNQAILTYGQQARLESSPVPETFVWGQL